MATFKECPECGNQIRIQNAECEESVVQLTCPECGELVEIYLCDDEEN